MNNKTGFNRLGRNASHRRALLKNLATSLIMHGKIQTTQAKAKELRSFVEKLVTRARVDSVHNRRMVARVITEKDVAKKLFTEVAPRYVGRPGGYTRIVKIGQRRGDASEMVVIEFVDAVADNKKEANIAG
ncbi:50S ribosomal protein L17 [Entomospira entomophila]|uniref:Large ribosomal subunit protein bL17 n=1 Tax=Entomospira entomophila TaxID=2719988 RepID=A0A968KQX5_9SPIO|nr:50S ribosomal protein L17 [Entomospira entomophilus]NIZ40229.1 50S ribosomal protein L17 [Entomospira entomophilus]WDI35788.1 50S ribosomal protein L17 [Entomospira entomophilus]